MDAAEVFLRQCVDDGQITESEFNAVRPGRESSGCTRPAWKTWEHGRVHHQLSEMDCEIYSNYPAWTLAGIAEHLGITDGVVRSALARVRRTLPSLRNDPSGNRGLPSLSHMIPLDAPGTHEPDGGGVIRF